MEIKWNQNLNSSEAQFLKIIFLFIYFFKKFSLNYGKLSWIMYFLCVCMFWNP